MNVKNILFVSAFFPPSIGGPATFVASIGPEFVQKGYDISYSNFEPYKKHSTFKKIFLFAKDLWHRSNNVDLVFIVDTWSVLVPAVLVCLLKKKKYIVRIGGDHLWETYITRTKKQVKLSTFYKSTPTFSFKEKIIFYLTRFSLKHAYATIFNTQWQRSIWKDCYCLEKIKTYVVNNALVTGVASYTWNPSIPRVLRCPVRASEVKNVEMVKRVWDSIKEEYPDVIFSFDFIDPKERGKLLSETYAVIQASISDVAPNLICESIASGCPFVCTDDTGLRELLSPDIGIFINTSSEQSIKQGLVTILDLQIHKDQSEKIRSFKISRTYKDLAVEYEHIWKN